MPKILPRDQAAALYARLAALNPAPETELEHGNPYTLLVAVVLSAQATDAGVNRATPRLFAAADTPQKMLELGEEQLGAYIKTIGLWRGKAKNIIAMSKMLVERHGGAVPPDRTALEKLPGVGRKTANVVLNVAFREPVIAVDTHIFRVANRTGLAPGKTPLEVELRLEKITPAEFLQNAHHWLILHGRHICVARTPKCPNCPIADICLYKDKTPADKAKPRRAERTVKQPTRRALHIRSSRLKPGQSAELELGPGVRLDERVAGRRRRTPQ